MHNYSYRSCDRAGRVGFQVALAGLVLAASVWLGGCPSSNQTPQTSAPDANTASNGSPSAADVAATPVAQGTVTLADGGTIAADDGLKLEVPSDSVPATVEIKLYRVAAQDLQGVDNSFLAGVMLEPDGLILATPAVLSVPLAEPADPNWPPLELEFRGNDPNNAIPTGALVGLSADGRTAKFEIRHFCGRIAARNCYSGVYEYLTGRWQQEHGATPAQIRARVKAKFPNVELPTDLTQATLMGRELQAFNETYCEHTYAYAPGEVIPDAVLSELTDRVQFENRNVIVMFAPALTERSGPEQFYTAFAHSGVFEYFKGQWQLRHSFPFKKDGLVEFMGGTNLAYWPIRRLNSGSAVFLETQDLTDFKESIIGVPFEAYICGRPGCGVPSAGADPSSIEYKTHPFLPLNERNTNHLWAAARIWVERPQSNPIHRLTGCWQFDWTDAEGTDQPYILKFDDQGQLESWWVKGPLSGVSDPVWGEIVRFTSANVGDLGLVYGNPQASITELDPPTQFNLVYSFDIYEVHDGTRGRKVASFTHTIPGTFSQNQPDEWWEGVTDFKGVVYAEDPNGPDTPQESTITNSVHATRVPCPDATAADVYSQEEVWALMQQWEAQ